MTVLSIPELLAKIDKNKYKVDKEGVELQAVQFWSTYKRSRLPNKKKLTQKKVGQAFGISATRMTVIIKDPSKIGKGVGTPQRIPIEEELLIVSWITQRCEAKMATTKEQVIKKANEIIVLHNRFALDTKRGPLTEAWFYNFWKRHKTKLSKRRVEGLDISRQMGRSTIRMLEYFSYLRDLLFQNKFKQSKIYNIDETPCPLNNIPRYSLWSKAVKDAHVLQPDNRMVLTMMGCIAANGTALPPLIIYHGKTVDVNYLNNELDVLVASNENAYMTQDIFRSWVKKFVELSNPTKDSPALLIMDNFVGHLDNQGIEYLFAHHVFVIGLPQHTSDLTQPLDLSVYGPYKLAYRKNFASIQEQTLIKTISQRDFTSIVIKSYKEAFSFANIASGFQRAGIVPFVPMVVLPKFNNWDALLYTEYIPNEDSSETCWTKLQIEEMSTENAISQQDSSIKDRDIIADVQNQNYNIELEKLTTFTAPTTIFKNIEPNDIRVNSYNTVLNRSDLYSISKIKQVKRDEQDAKKEKTRLKRKEKDDKLAEQAKVDAFLEISGLVQCFCKSKCTKRCRCYKFNQKCIHLCKCTCSDKDKSCNNQFSTQQQLATMEEQE